MNRGLPVALVLAAGCLGEPERPHGVGPPIASGSVVRHRAAVGDLNGDGYDDLALIGNEGGAGVAPTIFIFLGGETLQNPDLRVDLTVDDPDPFAVTPTWFEGVELAAPVSATAADAVLVAISAQDTTTDRTATGRRIYAHSISIDGRALGVHGVARGGAHLYGGYAPENTTTFVVQRATARSLPGHQILFGSDKDVLSVAAPVSATSQITPMTFDLPTPPYVWGALTLPATDQSQDLLLIGDSITTRTTGDPTENGTGTLRLAVGAQIPLPGSDNYRFARGRQVGDHFFAVTASTGDNTVAVIDVAGANAPVSYGFTSNSRVDDVAIAALGGGDAIDVPVLESGTLGVYVDVPPGANGSFVLPAAGFGSRDLLPSYDLLAVGNFHGDARLEIYVISTTDPATGILCYRMTGDRTLARCDGE